MHHGVWPRKPDRRSRKLQGKHVNELLEKQRMRTLKFSEECDHSYKKLLKAFAENRDPFEEPEQPHSA